MPERAFHQKAIFGRRVELPQLGNLKLTDEEEVDFVALVRTLIDNYRALSYSLLCLLCNRNEGPLPTLSCGRQRISKLSTIPGGFLAEKDPFGGLHQQEIDSRRDGNENKI